MRAADRQGWMWEAALAAAAVGLQVVHGVAGYDAGFMWIDLVGVPPMVAALRYGPRAGARVLLAPVLWILVMEPVGPMGAGFKASATLAAMVAASVASKRFAAGGAVVSVVLLAGGTSQLVAVAGRAAEVVGALALAAPAVAAAVVVISSLGRRPVSFSGAGVLLAAACAVTLRGSLMVVADLLFAFPVFFGVPPALALQQQPPWSIFFWNGVQATIDVGLAALPALAWRAGRHDAAD